MEAFSQIIDEICDAVSKWPDIAKECAVPQKMIEAIKQNFLFL